MFFSSKTGFPPPTYSIMTDSRENLNVSDMDSSNMDYSPCTSKNSKAPSRQERARQNRQTERVSRRRNLSRKEKEEEEEKEKDIPRATKQ